MPTLCWLTRNDDLKASERAPYRSLEHDPGLSAGAPNHGVFVMAELSSDGRDVRAQLVDRIAGAAPETGS